MSITASMNIETKHDDIVVIDDVQIIEDPVLAATQEAVTATTSDPLVPFLFVGVLSWVAILVAAIMLAF